jgi:hypothetical protein
MAQILDYFADIVAVELVIDFILPLNNPRHQPPSERAHARIRQ